MNSKKTFVFVFLAVVTFAFTSCKVSKEVDKNASLQKNEKVYINDETTITDGTKVDAQTSATAQTTSDATTAATTPTTNQSTSQSSDSNASDNQTANATNDRPPHEGFVYVKTLIPDLIEDLRYATTNNFMGEKADGYEGTRVILSRQAAEALKSAADELRQMGYVIKVFDAYRPQRAVNHFVRWSKTNDQRNKAEYFPTLRKNQLFPTYIAYKSGHTKGSTIDMTICDKNTKEEVDMGAHFDYFGEPSHPSFTGKYSLGTVTQEHKKRRLMLREVMVRHGFKPYDSEWWHFTLKNEPFPNTWFDFPVK